MNILPLPLPLLPLPVLPLPSLWRDAAKDKPAQPGWYLQRWWGGGATCRVWWDGVWWCVPINGELRRMEHCGINWKAEWKNE